MQTYYFDFQDGIAVRDRKGPLMYAAGAILGFDAVLPIAPIVGAGLHAKRSGVCSPLSVTVGGVPA